MPDECSNKEAPRPSIAEQIAEIRKTTDRIEACLIGSYETPGGLVARVVAVENAVKELEGVPDRLKDVEVVVDEVRSFKKWVLGAIGGAIVAGGVITKAITELLRGGGGGPPATQGP